MNAESQSGGHHAHCKYSVVSFIIHTVTANLAYGYVAIADIILNNWFLGESVPVMKGPPCVSPEIYSTEGHKRHTLFAGTHVIQTRFYGNNQVNMNKI